MRINMSGFPEREQFVVHETFTKPLLIYESAIFASVNIQHPAFGHVGLPSVNTLTLSGSSLLAPS